MKTGRRSFLKVLGATLAGLTAQGRLRALEDKKALNYQDIYNKNSFKNVGPVSITGSYTASGSYLMPMVAYLPTSGKINV